MESEREKAANKDKHKRHKPLASILSRKRSRSKSPPKLADAVADEVCVEKVKKSGMEKKRGDEDSEVGVQQTGYVGLFLCQSDYISVHYI